MSIQTYGELQNAVARWVKRTNISASAADFITLAEARLNRRLNVRQMRQTQSVVPQQPFVSLPGDYNRMQRVMYAGVRLDFYPELIADSNMGAHGAQGYTIMGNKVWLLTAVDGSSTLHLHYLAQLEPLSNTNPTNWLLEDGPDIYLYASLLETEPYLKNDARIAVWKGLLDQAITDLTDNDTEALHTGSPLVVRVG